MRVTQVYRTAKPRRVRTGTLLSRVAVGEQDSAADGSQQVLHSEPCVVLCAEAFMAIESDLEGFSPAPGRAAALGVRGGLAEGERAF